MEFPFDKAAWRPRLLGRGAALSIACLTTLGLLASLSYADHRPPRAVIGSGGAKQHGIIYSSEWVESRRGGACATSYRDGAGLLPRPPLRLRKSGKFRLTFRRRTRPRHVAVVAYERKTSRRTIDFGSPHQRLKGELHPRRSDQGKTTAWQLFARAKASSGPYLAVSAEWPDREGCHSSQTAAWAFNFRPD